MCGIIRHDGNTIQTACLLVHSMCHLNVSVCYFLWDALESKVPYVSSQMVCQRNDLPNQSFSLFKTDWICDSLSGSYALKQVTRFTVFPTANILNWFRKEMVVSEFWGASFPLCWFNNKEFLCVTHKSWFNNKEFSCITHTGWLNNKEFLCITHTHELMIIHL